MKIPGLGGWADDPLWASVYDWSVEHRRLGGLFWRLGLRSDLDELYAATREISRQPAGSRVLDVPVGGGVALRALRPEQQVDYVAADISPGMLARTRERARELGLQDQLRCILADVGDLPFADGEFDLVVSFTGLHCFPDPRRAVTEMARVLRPGGVLAASAVLNDTGLFLEPVRLGGRLSGLIGPSASRTELHTWLREEGMDVTTLRTSGPIGYLRAVKR